MKGVVEEMYVTAKGSAQMERVEEVRTIEGCGAHSPANRRSRRHRP
jgi:hypothetical protein